MAKKNVNSWVISGREAEVLHMEEEDFSDPEKDSEAEEDDEGKKAEDEKDPLDDFLQTDEVQGLDDHVDLEINPVLMHNIKKAKDEERLRKRREDPVPRANSAREAGANTTRETETEGEEREGEERNRDVLFLSSSRRQHANTP